MNLNIEVFTKNPSNKNEQDEDKKTLGDVTLTLISVSENKSL